MCLNRVDYLSDYKIKDTLILLLELAINWSEYEDGHRLLEKVGDYTTRECTNSVLRLSNGYVTGNMLTNYLDGNNPYSAYPVEATIYKIIRD